MKTQQARRPARLVTEESDRGNVKSDYTWKGPVSCPQLGSIVYLFAIFAGVGLLSVGVGGTLSWRLRTFPDSRYRFTAFRLGAVIMDPSNSTPRSVLNLPKARLRASMVDHLFVFFHGSFIAIWPTEADWDRHSVFLPMPRLNGFREHVRLFLRVSSWKMARPWLSRFFFEDVIF
jgi:hypothetical protein